MHTRINTVMTAAALLCTLARPADAGAATLHPHTIAAWNVYIAATEARIARELADGRRFLGEDFGPNREASRRRVLGGDVTVGELDTRAAGVDSVAVPDGIVHHWRGSVMVPGVTLAELLSRLEHPSERGPHQQDVLVLKVLARDTISLRLFIKMTRQNIVTVTYNTEHTVAYRRHGPTRASSRSMATKVAELEGAGTAAERERPASDDRGFLWRMNSYWRYEEVDGGVVVELESVTLSRTVPLGLRVVVEPMIDRVARESMERTLDTLRRTHAGAATAARRAAAVPPR